MANTMLTGWWRLEARSPSDITYDTILEEHTSKFGGTVGSPEADPSVWPTILPSNTQIPQDSKLVLRFRPDATVTEKSSAGGVVDTISIPSRLLDVVVSAKQKTPFVFPKTMAAVDFTSLRPAANSQLWTAGQYYDVFEYVVPAGRVLKVGQAFIAGADNRVMNKFYLQRDVVTS
jgi:hypothetical protein